MTETELEMIENRAERENDAILLRLCLEIRRLHRRLHDQKPRPHPPLDLKPIDCFELGHP